MNIVLDTNVLISATLWGNGSAQKTLSKLIEKKVTIFTSNALIAEYYKVVMRDFNYSEDKTTAIVENFLSIVKIVETKEILNIVKDDPDDNKVLECAVASSSTYIVTYDKHLLNLKEFRGIKIIKPEEIINLL